MKNLKKEENVEKKISSWLAKKIRKQWKSFSFFEAGKC